jgi:acyl transferase domain-containing protein/acyl carrier protein
MNGNEPGDEQDGIAIVGMAVRLPGARNVDEFWRNLCAGVESVSRFSEEELLESGMDPATIHHPNFVPAKAIMADVDLFDAPFFGISPREAELMDPQHRLLMECAWEAIEHAGYDTEAYDGRIAVFTSAGMNTYLPINILSNPGLAERVGGFQLSIFNDKDFAPTRIAHSMNLQGPGVDIGTACSSSLVSTHFACQSLSTYQCDMALVGAITVHLPLKVGHLREEGSAYSPDGHCRPFDSTPSGLIDGNGMAAVVLKRLTDAIADRDTIHAVIKGSAINNDGSMKLGYAAPSVEGQARVIAEAQAMAGCHPDTISYVEAHGTATPLGDPVEMAGLTQAFRLGGTERTGYCGIGAVKSNIGHVDKAAGLAGLIKTALALKHGRLPPTLHFKRPNPRLNLPDTPFYVVDSLRDWARDGGSPRRAGVSSFGVGGTNAHAVLEEAPPAEAGSASRPVQVLTLSAKTEAALQAAAENLAAFIEQRPTVDLADMCHTLQRGRRPFAFRRAVTSSSASDAIVALRTPQAAQICDRTDRRVAFLFPGQGSQYPGMARDLYLREPVFRQEIDECARRLEGALGLDIRDLLFPAESALQQAAAQLAQTAITQPALFAVEYALAQLWTSWGVRPDAMIGHSLGEYVAACLAGVFALPDALALIAARGRMMQGLPPGAMAAVPLPEQELLPLLGDRVELAAVNGPRLCVVSGPEPMVTAFQEHLAAQNLSCSRLHTSHAFHSAMMSPMIAPFTALLRQIELKPPQIPYISNVTGDWIAEADATRPEYWAEQLRRPVRFAAGVARLVGAGSSLLVEVGPGRTLSGLAAQSEGMQRPHCFTSLPQAREKSGAQDVLLRTLGDLWQAGVNVDWAGFYRHEQRLRVPLPTYPFQRQRYWIEPGRRSATGAPPDTGATKSANIADWFYLPSWKATASPSPSPRPDTGIATALVFADEHGLADALDAELARTNHDVVKVRPGAGFARTDASTYTIDPSQPADFTALLDDLYARGSLPQRITYLWGLTRKTGIGSEHDEIGAYAGHVLSLVQALSWLSLDHPIELFVIANGLCDVGGEAAVEPAKAALLGPLNTTAWEFPGIACRAIDIPSPETAAFRPRGLAARLIREIHAPAADRIVALRTGHRWVADLDPIRLDADTASGADGVFRSGGTYLIIGGLSEIGLCFAHQIARIGPVKLALTTTDPSVVSAAITQRLDELDRRGCETLHISLDALDPEQWEAAFVQAEKHLGQIAGVIHAGDMSQSSLPSLIKDLDQTARDRYWRQQQQSLMALEQCLERRETEFCMIMSSLASELGGIGQAVRSTAAAWLDAFAARANRRSACAWTVVNWDMWRAEDAIPGAASALAALAMTPAEGSDAFGRIAQDVSFARILVSTSDPRLRRQALRTPSQTGSSTSPAGSSGSGASASAGGHQRPDLAVSYAPPRNDDEATVADLWQDILGLDGIGVHDNFFDLGGHSLIATQLVSRLQQAFGVNVELDMFFSAPTIAEFTEALQQKQIERSGEDEMARLLDRLEEMTEEGAAALLASGDLPEELLAALDEQRSNAAD